MASDIVRQRFTILDRATLQDRSDSLSVDSTVGWSVVLLLAGMVCWRLIDKHHNRRSAALRENSNSPLTQPTSNSSTITVASESEDQEDQPLNLPHFTQPIQWVSYGKLLERQKKYDQAITVYNQGLQHHPNYFRFWHERGLALVKLERFEQALESYDRAYELRPDYPDLVHERGDALLQLMRYEEAVAAFDVYLQYVPNGSHVLADRGYALYQLQRYEEALNSLNQVLNSRQSDRDSTQYAHYYQIQSLSQLGHLGVALQSSQKAIQRYPQEHFMTLRESLRQQIAAVLTDHQNESIEETQSV